MTDEYDELIDVNWVIHVDLSDALRFNLERIKDRRAKGDLRGIFHDYVSGFVFCAFCCEANVSFVGNHVFQNDWNEMSSLNGKISKLQKRLRLGWKRDTEPWATMIALQDLRNTLAHGKPIKDSFKRPFREPQKKKSCLGTCALLGRRW